MSVPNSQTENPAQPSRSEPDSERSCLAPKRGHDGCVRPRKVLPRRLPSAPQLLPMQGAATLGRAVLAIAPVSGPDLLAQDAVLRRLLSATPDPQPFAVQPLRDPLGHALGMLARLMVAGCAAAAVAMLLIGALPLPSNFGARATHATKAQANAVNRLATVTVGPAPSAAEPARVSTVSVRSPQAPVDGGALDAQAIANLLKRGEDSLAQGDIAAARLILSRVAEAGDAAAALSLGETYDPQVLHRLRVVGVKPDLAQARTWYQKAAAYGSIEASRQLSALPRPDR